ncbi:Cytosolic carboxypeptidase 2 [Borealophlyctis nickersoniae]|nr:Cytosolic carboxypeptidase 2 [Borealophlyctis nickersoniae]
MDPRAKYSQFASTRKDKVAAAPSVSKPSNTASSSIAATWMQQLGLGSDLTHKLDSDRRKAGSHLDTRPLVAIPNDGSHAGPQNPASLESTAHGSVRKERHVRSWTDPEGSVGARDRGHVSTLIAVGSRETIDADLRASRREWHHPEFQERMGTLASSAERTTASQHKLNRSLVHDAGKEDTLADDEEWERWEAFERASKLVEKHANDTKADASRQGMGQTRLLPKRQTPKFKLEVLAQDPYTTTAAPSSYYYGDEYVVGDEYIYDDEGKPPDEICVKVSRPRLPIHTSAGPGRMVGLRPLLEPKEEMAEPIWPPGMRCMAPTPVLNHLPPNGVERLTKVPESMKGRAGMAPPPKRARTTYEPKLVFEAQYDESPMKPFYQLQSPDDSTLLFESRFESGNLQEAYRVDQYEYEMKVRKDLNTRGHTQWFYFRVTNMRPNIPYRFNITNLMKPDSLYNYGMRPLMYSEKTAATKGIGWHRAGTDISYYRSAEESSYAQRPLHTLTFTVVFESADDVVYFTHCYPYTYSDLQRYLHALKQHPDRAPLFRHRVLGKTLAGNRIDMLSVTRKVESPNDLKRRKGIIVSARVHPGTACWYGDGETNSSWMMKGFIDFVVGDSPEASFLRDNFVIKIIPMLNPDGVIVGNHRCNLLGYDLNRQWEMGDDGIDYAPEIFYAKEMIGKLSQAREFSLYCDMHGHKHGIFMYGCHNDDNAENRYKERVFPFMLSKHAPDLFFFKRCQFKIQRAKEGTGRISLWRRFKLINSFTMEASFCGSDTGPNGGFHYTTSDLEEMGRTFGKTLYDYFAPVEAKEGGSMDVAAAAEESSGWGVSDVAAAMLRELRREFEKGNQDLAPEESGEGEDDTTSDDEAMRIPPKKKKVLTKKAVAPRPSTPSSTKSPSGKSTPRPSVTTSTTEAKTAKKTQSEAVRSVRSQVPVKKVSIRLIRFLSYLRRQLTIYGLLLQAPSPISVAPASARKSRSRTASAPPVVAPPTVKPNPAVNTVLLQFPAAAERPTKRYNVPEKVHVERIIELCGRNAEKPKSSMLSNCRPPLAPPTLSVSCLELTGTGVGAGTSAASPEGEMYVKVEGKFACDVDENQTRAECEKDESGEHASSSPQEPSIRESSKVANRNYVPMAVQRCALLPVERTDRRSSTETETEKHTSQTNPKSKAITSSRRKPKVAWVSSKVASARPVVRVPGQIPEREEYME